MARAVKTTARNAPASTSTLPITSAPSAGVVAPIARADPASANYDCEQTLRPDGILQLEIAEGTPDADGASEIVTAHALDFRRGSAADDP